MTDEDFSSILSAIGAGERASPRMMEVLYDELHSLAHRLMRSERHTHTLQPTALVHEAFLRLVDAEKAGSQGELYFLDAAAVTMRRVLVDHARANNAEKRGGNETRHRVTVGALSEEEPDRSVDVATLDAALAELAELDARHAKIVELRFFGGMTGEQIAEHLGISRRTVVRELTFSRAWLKRRLASRGVRPD